MANVYYSKIIDDNSIREIFSSALKEANLVSKDRIAVKVHFGEQGQSRFVSPKNIWPVVDILKKTNSNMFITDTNTLYRGLRTNATDHKKIALKHGFGELDLDIIIADGEKGDSEEEIYVNSKHFEKVKIGKEIVESDAIIFISHFKGHSLFGYGGAIKNIGMGCGSRAGKLAMHSMINPSINQNTCTGCGVCVKHCDFDAVEVGDSRKAKIDDNKCSGCAICISVCPENAVSIPWHGAAPVDAMERCAEYALGAVKNKKCVYITFANNITKHCDCLSDSDIIGEDVGIFASIDPVSADKAAYDMIKKKHGKDIFLLDGRADGTHIMSYSEKLGLGESKYKLIEL